MFSFILWWQVYCLGVLFGCGRTWGLEGTCFNIKEDPDNGLRWRESPILQHRGCGRELSRTALHDFRFGHRPQVSCRILGSTEDTLWTFVDFLAGRELEYFYKRPQVKEEQISKKGRNHKKYSSLQPQLSNWSSKTTIAKGFMTTPHPSRRLLSVLSLYPCGSCDER